MVVFTDEEGKLVECPNARSNEHVEISDAAQGKEILSSEYDEYDDYGDGTAKGNLGRHLSRSAFELHGMRRLAVFGLPTSKADDVWKLKRIFTSLRDEAGDFSQIGALTELCEILSFDSEELWDRFNVDSFVPILVGFLNQEGSPDLMLLAVRALMHICDIFPYSCSSVVYHGVISYFYVHFKQLMCCDVDECNNFVIMATALLLEYDFVQRSDLMVREARRSLSKKLVTLLDSLDDLGA